MDSWPFFWKHNKPLFDAMIAAGWQFKDTGPHRHFVDKIGNYVAYPVGYITGPTYYSDSQKYYASVMGPNGWLQRGFASRQNACEWALGQAKEILTAERNS